MNLNNEFNRLFSSVAPLKSDEELYDAVIERTRKMKNKNKIATKRAVFIVAAAVMTVALGITAAAQLDIVALFMDGTQKRAEELNEFRDDYYEDYVEHWYPEISEIEIPQSVASEKTSEEALSDKKSKDKIISMITGECEKTIKCEGYDINVKGYSYDGYSFKLFMDFVFDKEGKYYSEGQLTVKDPFVDLDIVVFAIEDTFGFGGGGGSGTVTSINDNVISYTESQYLQRKEGNASPKNLKAVIVPEGRFEEACENEAYEIPIELSNISELICEKEIEREVEFIGSGTAKLNKLIISPLHVAFVFSDMSFDIGSIGETPCFITLKNGEVIDLSYSGKCMSDYRDSLLITISSGDITVLDVNDIESVQLYNEVIYL